MQLARSQSSSCDNPALDIYVSVAGSLVDIAVLEFEIYDISTDEKAAEPVKVYPAGDGRAEVDPATDCPNGGRLGVGRYVGAWTVPADESLGAHEVRWYFNVEAGWDEGSWVEEFEVTATIVPVADGFRHYCSVADLRAEGVTVALASDERLEELIDEATREIDGWTRWWFDVQARTLAIDGSGHGTLILPAPVIRLDGVTISSDEGTTELDVDDIVIDGPAPVREPYSGPGPALRYTGELPDSWATATFAAGVANVAVEGLFGRTEYDGTVQGRVPRSIRRACMLLAMKRVIPLVEDDDSRRSHRIKTMKTTSQSVTFADVNPASAPFSGDPEIDQILMRLAKPMAIGVA